MSFACGIPSSTGTAVSWPYCSITWSSSEAAWLVATIAEAGSLATDSSVFGSAFTIASDSAIKTSPSIGTLEDP